MPLTTAIFAVIRTHERAAWQFLAAAGTGTIALVALALARAGGGGDLAGSVEGASVTRAMPGRQVTS